MTNFNPPKIINILGRDYSAQWATNDNIDGCTATINIGRTFRDEEAAEHFAMHEIGGIDGVTSFRLTAAGDVVMSVRP
jgi:hypothetical protein